LFLLSVCFFNNKKSKQNFKSKKKSELVSLPSERPPGSGFGNEFLVRVEEIGGDLDGALVLSGWELQGGEINLSNGGDGPLCFLEILCVKFLHNSPWGCGFKKKKRRIKKKKEEKKEYI
jgi:hypothetical protein